MRRSFLTVPALLTLLLPALLTAGCGGGEDPGPDPTATVVSVATALSDRDFSTVSFADRSTRAVTHSFDRLVEGMRGLTPAVVGHAVERKDTTATASLTWTWPTPGGEWTYDSTIDLHLVGETWQVTWSPAVVEPSLGADESLDLTTITPQRGKILGAHGLSVVEDRPVVRYGIDRGHVAARRAADSARRLAALVGVDVGSFVERVRGAGPEQFVEAIAYRREQVPAEVLAAYDSIPGALAYAGDLPLAPTSTFAAPLLGSVGEVTAEMIEKDPESYHLGDRAGLSGLQARYDDLLRGRVGSVVEATSAQGEDRELFRADAARGTDLRLSLDVDLQLEAEHLLSSIGPASALVAIRPSTGAVLVAADGPGNHGLDLATFGQFAPGSTFKSVSSLALLRAGLTPDSVVPCTSSITVDGKRFENYDDYPPGELGDIALRTAVANSCNTALISQAQRLRAGDLADAAASLGLGIDHEVGFPAYFGSVPEDGTQTEAAADMIGQGQVLASPLAMATVIASIQAGHLVVPHLVDPSTPGLDRDQFEAPPAAPALGRTEAAHMHEMLRAVVTSGSGRGLADLPGSPVIAKTGTAEFDRDGERLLHAWMIAAQGDLAVAVFVDVGSSGSGTAGPILESFLRAAR